MESIACTWSVSSKSLEFRVHRNTGSFITRMPMLKWRRPCQINKVDMKLTLSPCKLPWELCITSDYLGGVLAKITHPAHGLSSQFPAPEITLKVLFWNNIGACVISPLIHPPPHASPCKGNGKFPQALWNHRLLRSPTLTLVSAARLCRSVSLRSLGLLSPRLVKSQFTLFVL